MESIGNIAIKDKGEVRKIKVYKCVPVLVFNYKSRAGILMQIVILRDVNFGHDCYDGVWYGDTAFVPDGSGYVTFVSETVIDVDSSKISIACLRRSLEVHGVCTFAKPPLDCGEYNNKCVAVVRDNVVKATMEDKYLEDRGMELWAIDGMSGYNSHRGVGIKKHTWLNGTVYSHIIALDKCIYSTALPEYYRAVNKRGETPLVVRDIIQKTSGCSYGISYDAYDE